MTSQRRKKGSLLGFVLVFLMGAGILAYPTISFWLAERQHIAAHQTYGRNVANLTREEKQTLWDIAVHYNERLVKSVVQDPFAGIENVEPFDEYYQTLDVGDGVMGYINIPAISVLLPVYHGISDEVLEKGVGHIPTTALPVGGEGTHAVLTGHTGLSHAKMFNDLVELRYGDEFYLEILDETLAYRIEEIEIVLPDDVSGLQREEGRDTVTLVTCTPYSVNSHRLLVTGERVPYTPEMEQDKVDNKVDFPYWVPIIVVSIVLLILRMGRIKNAVQEDTHGKKTP